MAAEGSDPVSPRINRDELLGDRNLVGTVFCRAYARRADEWLQLLFERLGPTRNLSLVALGGFGRATLSPESDLDVMLLHSGWKEADLAEAAEALWFPVWDAKIALGHSVRTISQTLELADTDLETATSLISLRHLAGDAELSDDLAERAARHWRANRRRWLPQIIDDAVGRERLNGEVAYLLEPDLKSARGGLRDVNAVDWIEAAGIAVLDQERRDLRAANETLLAARVELHRSTGRKGDRLLLEEQDAVAEALGIGDADVMMSRVSAAARTVTWIADDVFHRARNTLRRLRLRSKPRRAADGVTRADGVVALHSDASVGNDQGLLLRLAVAAARHDARIDRHSLDDLVELGPPIRTPWKPEIRDLFVDLLRTGHSAIHVIETLDHVGLFTRLLPEWEPTRSKVQRNQYHRFTVDRHLLEAAAIAAGLTGRVSRPDLLLVGALLHDIGKGYPGDHTEVGMRLIDEIAPAMGFDPVDVTTLRRLCEHHLLLPDVATRRDLDDPGTIESVASQVGTVEFLHLLAALTEADSRATGPSAWSSWKAQLIDELVRSTESWLTADRPLVSERRFPDDTQLVLLRSNEHLVLGTGDSLTVVTKDRPGLFARVSGALALSNLNIIDAQTHAEDGKVLDVVRVVDADDEHHVIEWEPVVERVEEILGHSDDLTPRFAAREASMLRRVAVSPSPIEPARVDFDNAVSAHATVIEIAGPDRLGLLYEMSSALARAGLDIQRTHIQTVGADVVDAFYVQTLNGEKLTDAGQQQKLRTALLAILNNAPV